MIDPSDALAVALAVLIVGLVFGLAFFGGRAR